MQNETEHQQVASSERPAEDEESAQRVREPLSFGMSVAGTVAAFIAGFGILPSSTLAEKAFILIIAIALSGAIISGIGAWRSVKRFVFMAISASLAFLSLAALAVAAQDGAAVPQAQGTVSPASPVNKQSASDAPVVAPATTGTSSSRTGQSSGPGTSGGYALTYSQQKFTLPGDGDGCQSVLYRSYVLFSEQGPQVTPYPGSYSNPTLPWDMIMNCFGNSDLPDIEFSGSAATISDATNPNACQTAINTDPMSTGIKFATLNPGMQVCMINNASNEAGNELILVTLKSVSTSTYDTTWTATVWGRNR